MYFIISTVNSRFDHVRANLPPDRCVIVNQGYDDGRYSGCRFAGVIQLSGWGLSVSRNAGLDFAFSNRLPGPMLLCDDDVVYDLKSIESIVPRPESILIFRIADPDGVTFKDYQRFPTRFSKVHQLGRISSIEICINSSLALAECRFDPQFGLGAQYPAGGEEFLFLRDVLRNGVPIVHLPVFIGKHPRGSTGDNIQLLEYWVTRKYILKKTYVLWWGYYFLLGIKKLGFRIFQTFGFWKGFSK